jgi:hypothetical protein
MSTFYYDQLLNILQYNEIHGFTDHKIHNRVYSDMGTNTRIIEEI